MSTPRRRAFAAACWIALLVSAAHAQTTLTPSGSNLYNDLTAGVYNALNPNAISGISTDTRSNLLNGIGNNFTNLLGLGIANQLLLIPTVSPASGILFKEDAVTGAPIRTRRGLGPVFAERAETMGRGQFFLGFAFQQINFGTLGVRQMSFNDLGKAFGANDVNETQFSTLKAMPLDNFPMVFQQQFEVTSASPHGAPVTPCPCGNPPDAWNTLPLFNIPTNSLTIHTSQTTAFFTYGLTNWFDASLLLPVVRTSVEYQAENPVVLNVAQAPSLSPFLRSGTGTGIGDVTLRLKVSVLSRGATGFAIGSDVRFPTGDEKNFRGTGAGGVKPFVVISRAIGRVTPHGNFGYQINGNSILAGDVNLVNPSQTKKGHLPNSFNYIGGADIAANDNLTISADVIGQRLFKAQVLHLFPDMPLGVGNNVITSGYLTPYGMVNYGGKYVEDLNVVTGAVGFKALVAGNLMVTGNVLIKLNNTGLRARAIPLFGLSYAF